MDLTLLFIGLAVLVDGIAGLAGGLLSERWMARHLSELVAFAAGALLGAVFLDLLPHAVATAGPSAFPWAFTSFLALALFSWLLGPHHHDHSTHAPGHPHHPEHLSDSQSVVPSLLAADALHNLGDGAALAAAFLVSPEAGVATTVAIIAHELPQEVGDYALLRAAGLSRGRSLAALAGVQLTAAVGAGAVLLGSRFMEGLEGIILALASGTFLYIGATDLLPDVRRGGTPRETRGRMLGFLLGVALVAGVGFLEETLLLPHP
jgi:zinc and cadmium transporter